MQLLLIIDSGLEEINLLDGIYFEKLDTDNFSVHGIIATCKIKTFMKNVAGRKKTYRPFKGNTYYEFVEDEELKDEREVILMYSKVCELLLIYYIFLINYCL